MKIFITLDDDGFANGWSSTATEGNTAEMDLPEDHAFFRNMSAHKFQDGNMVFDAEREAQVIAAQQALNEIPTDKEKITKLHAQVKAANDYTDFLEEVIVEMAQVVYK
ncbi:hypothetical protein [Planococcus koreensis]|uniref:hypothetical protein n=1 Tax=Planococcus koreensis TaxID=112331 RepID=UPI0039FB8F63